MKSSNDQHNVSNEDEFTVIGLSMIDKTLFYPLTVGSTFAVHTCLYPITVIRTRLVAQEGEQLYRGIIHATKIIMKNEGFRSFYSGYVLKTVQNVPSILFITAYESIRNCISQKWPESSGAMRSLVSALSASTILQCILVPFDVISQHSMLARSNTQPEWSASNRTSRPKLTPLRLKHSDMTGSYGITRGIIREIYRLHGLRGFYQGFTMSVFTFAPHTGMFWMFYTKYCDMLSGRFRVKDQRLHRIVTQQLAAPMASISNSLILNTFDTIRIRMQVENTNLRTTCRKLYREDGVKLLKRGLLARVVQSSLFSSLMILMYERVKEYSLKQEHWNNLLG